MITRPMLYSYKCTIFLLTFFWTHVYFRDLLGSLPLYSAMEIIRHYLLPSPVDIKGEAVIVNIEQALFSYLQ